ncbi:pimeloyl-ACP methyl ester carboxylesterase [Mumia flava]|uniref:Pimeloyl-ACP methyl ester carboxylesterase n=1 Tax=Mumia flava TaxID=1348852 RepID=A0A0B2AYQ8_9ACTN|nr:alpha/beta hydrolase [Mumia flava]PJJ56969.1 pimeloyl-ACP methyl ester carboxylesterase [Mumia flava]
MTGTYRTHLVGVDGGALHVGEWGAELPVDAPTALLVHGVTASHRSWTWLAGQLPGVRLIAPDLRGRGRSNSVRGPAGMAAHADDLARVLEAFGVDRTVVVGHSMGAFVTAVLGHRHPDRVARQVFLDGGFPLDVPEGLDADQVIATVLGPTAERLAMTFASTEDYLAFWRRHPAFASDWDAALEDYFRYDLVGEAGALRPSTTYATTAEDTIDLHRGNALVDALAALRLPTLLVTAGRGLLDEAPGLYAPERTAALLAGRDGVRHEHLAELNHYTLVMSVPGAVAIAGRIERELAAVPA